MDTLKRAADALQKAETHLRDLVAEAATSGDYQTVVQVAAWASAISDLLKKSTGGKFAGQTKPSSNGAASKPKASSGKNDNCYPRFFRQGDELVRVAWSRRSRAEYQHKTSETVLKTVTDTLCKVGKEGRVFSTDEILPVRDNGGSEVPAYQAYVCIALLKIHGLIDQHGRQGYSITRLDDFSDAVQHVWRKLPAK